MADAQSDDPEKSVASAHAEDEPLRPIEKFFHNSFFAFINRLKIPIQFFFLAILVVGIVFSFRLEPPEEEEALTSEDYMFYVCYF